MRIFFITILILIAVFWDWFKANVSVIGTIATALAFFATAWAAFEGRRSAKAALTAVQLSEKALEESRKNFRKEAFNQRFSLLLEQHNTYLEKVNNYLRTDSGWLLISSIYKSPSHHNAFCSLRGHIVFSPYMRVLYHTLKFICEDFYNNEDDIVSKKKYSSLIRSLISNDVLFLIAINASYTLENNERNQFQKFQYLLDYFDFFEHANFFSICHQTDSSKVIESKDPFEKTNNNMKDLFTYYLRDGKYELIDSVNYQFEPSVVISYLYKNPSQKSTKMWFDSISNHVYKIFESKLNNKTYEDIFNDHFNHSYIDAYIDNKGFQIDTSKEYEVNGKPTLTKGAIKSIMKAILNKGLNLKDNQKYRFLKMKEGNAYIRSYNKMEDLVTRINEYNLTVLRKNHIEVDKNYKAISNVIKNIKQTEKKIREQAYDKQST